MVPGPKRSSAEVKQVIEAGKEDYLRRPLFIIPGSGEGGRRKNRVRQMPRAKEEPAETVGDIWYPPNKVMKRGPWCARKW